ncbi:MAG TPA: hypothetical protein VGU02_00985 [Gaiellaceae bacterium]|nr:hypothetical protein [Gaiellaceae bacterium]
MAQRNYWVDGLSGTGKSSVYEELLRRGFMAISTDRAWSHHETRMWVEQRAIAELESDEPDVLFVCGGSRERERYAPYFTKVFNLRIDNATMLARLGKRTESDWSLGEEGVELSLELNRSDEGAQGAIDVDATQPLEQVVDEILRLAGCSATGSWRPEWDVLPAVRQFLEERGVDITWRLDPSAFDPAELRRYYERLHGAAAKGVGYAMADGIAYLRDSAERDA